VYQGLLAVGGLARGRTDAPEPDPVGPVTDADVDKTLPYLSRHVRGMVEVQRLTGMRPGEVCRLRAADIDRVGPVWFYRPAQHKTAHKGKDRAVAIGPRAQQVLSEFPTDDPTSYVFSPGRRKAGRVGTRYAVRSYRQAVVRACDRAGVAHWHPNQLRHTRGTEVRKVYGLAAAQCVLGHANAKVTEVYAERDGELAVRVALETG
jgi:integrase